MLTQDEIKAYLARSIDVNDILVICCDDYIHRFYPDGTYLRQYR